MRAIQSSTLPVLVFSILGMACGGQPMPIDPQYLTHSIPGVTDGERGEPQPIPPGDLPEGVPKAVGLCASCHGLDGRGTDTKGNIPNLAGQNTDYLTNQIDAFLNDYRPRPQNMSPYITLFRGNLTALDEITKYYSEMAPPQVPNRNMPAVASTCVSCHGQNGISLFPFVPNLAGQPKNYLRTQLKSFRDGTRKNPQMEGISRNLTADQIEDLAEFFGGK